MLNTTDMKRLVRKPRYRTKGQRVNINLPAGLYKQLQELCYKNGMNVSHFIAMTLINKIKYKPDIYGPEEPYDIE